MSRTIDPERRQLIERFVEGVLRLGYAEVEIGPLERTKTKYLTFWRAGDRTGLPPVYVLPETGRVTFRLPEEAAVGRAYAVSLNTTSAYKVWAVLGSAVVVDEAVELAAAALQATAS